MRLIPLLAFAALAATPADSKHVFDQLKRGAALTAEEVQELATRVEKKPRDGDLIIQLLSYYASPRADLAAQKAARAKYIARIVELDPKEGFGLFQMATGVHRINCRGDALADPDAARRIADMWMQAIERNSSESAIRREAADWIRFCDPEQAERLYVGSGEIRSLGALYADGVLGVTGQSYTSSDPSGSDAGLRSTPFAQHAHAQLEGTDDKVLIVSAANNLLRRGAILWADGKLDWDYTPFGNQLLGRAKQMDPGDLGLLTLPTKLPAAGERPPATIRVGGNVMAGKLIRQPPPSYPPLARSLRIQGTVRMNVLLGLDGTVLDLKVVSGPAELVEASTNSVRQWVYKPTMLNGKPCYITTVVDVTFTLAR